MLAWIKKVIKGGTEDFGKGLVVSGLLAIAAVALRFWPGAWPYIRHLWFGIDSEVARQAVFILVVILDLLVLVVPSRRVIEVAPIKTTGAEALLSVMNRGKKATFYADAVLLELKVPGMMSSQENSPLKPVWLPAGPFYINYTSLRRNETGRLRLAQQEQIPKKDLFAIVLEDVGDNKPKAPILWTLAAGEGPAIRIRVTITREEETNKWRLLRPPKPYSADYTIRANVYAKLWIETASR